MENDIAVDLGPRRDDQMKDAVSVRQAVLRMSCASAVLAVAHYCLAQTWPSLADTRPNSTIHLGWFVADLFVAGSILLTRGSLRSWSMAFYALGYAIILWLLWPLIKVMEENLLLLVLTLMVYGGLARRPVLVGYLFLFLISQRFLPAYLYTSFLLMSLLYATLPPFLRLLRRRQVFLPLSHFGGLVLLTALLLPILFYCTQTSPQNLRQRLDEAEVTGALWTSLTCSVMATSLVLVLGVPLAYSMVRISFPGRGLINALIDLPIVVPPPIAGIVLLEFLGPKSPLGQFLESQFGVRLFDSQWGIVAAQAFVGSPYLIRASMVAFSAVDVRIENVARTLGASRFSAFLRITLPLSLRGILIGVVLTWFRAMAEFGSLRIMANRPLTMPILAFERFINFGKEEAQSIGALNLIMCLSVVAGLWFIRAMPSIITKPTERIDAAY